MFTHHFLLDPVVLGTFPECNGTAFEPLIAAVSPEELTVIHAVPDFLGYNIYNGNAVRAEGASFAYVPRYPGFPDRLEMARDSGGAELRPSVSP